MNEIQAEWEELMRESEFAEAQLDWISTRLTALETIMALYSPALLKPKLRYPDHPIKTETILVAFPDRILKAVESTEGKVFDVPGLMRLLRLRGVEHRQRLAIKKRVRQEVVDLTARGVIEPIEWGFRLKEKPN